MTTEIYDSLNSRFYNTNAEELAGQYLSKSFEEVHASWLAHLPSILNLASSDDTSTHAPVTKSSLIHSANNSPIRILDSGDARKMHSVSIEQLETLGRDVGLAVIDKTDMDTDKLGRTYIYWQTLVLAHASISTASTRSACD